MRRLMQIGTPLSESLRHFLDVTSDAMKLTASNAANVDTPGYKTLGLDFGSAMASAMRGDSPSGAVQEVDGLVSRPDGNNVSLDRESMDLAKEQLQFRAGIEFLKHEYSRTMDAIHADGK